MYKYPSPAVFLFRGKCIFLHSLQGLRSTERTQKQVEVKWVQVHISCPDSSSVTPWIHLKDTKQ